MPEIPTFTKKFRTGVWCIITNIMQKVEGRIISPLLLLYFPVSEQVAQRFITTGRKNSSFGRSMESSVVTGTFTRLY